MGVAVSYKEFDQNKFFTGRNTVIFCNKLIMNFNDFHVVSLGKELASSLIRYPECDRANIIISELDKILLRSKYERILIKDIDILFNPSYKLNVLKYFCNLGRKKIIIVFWNGKIKDDYIQYGEIGYRDYNKYLIKDYNAIFVK